MVGIDLLLHRIQCARRAFPAIDFRVGNGMALEFEDDSFDLVLCYTLFSSILDRAVAARVAAEIERVLKVGGAIVWYDLRYPNPGNRNVRAMPAAEVVLTFRTLQASLRTVTLIPPLARCLGRMAPVAYPALARISALRSHVIGLLVKQPRS
jgi:ubiquinone/menaquinone biosynthesis C-methylase UbiE